MIPTYVPLSPEASAVRSRLRRSLIAIASLAAGCAGGSADVPPHERASTLSFADVTEASGLAEFRHERGAAGDLWFPEINGSGVAVIDYDGDGWPDILLAGGSTWPGSGQPPPPAVRLFRNEGDGTFSDQTESAGLATLATYSYGFAIADIDNDGDEDFYLTTVTRNRLFRNDGGRFTEITTEAGLGQHSEWSNSAAFYDADRDGLLDLIVTNYVEWSPEGDIPCLFGKENRRDYCTPHLYQGLPPRFYKNLGEGRFVEETDRAGFTASPGKSMGVALLDFDQDAWLDVAISNDGEPDQLFRNNGDGTFTDIGIVAGMALNSRGSPQAGMGIDAGDVDGSGRDAIIVGNFANETMGLYVYDGEGFFVDRTRSSGVGTASTPTLTFGVMLFDPDLDGDQDVLAVNGHISLFADESEDASTFEQPPHLFLNHGDGTFTDFAPQDEVLRRPLLGRGAAYADFDRDGDVDLLVTTNGGGVRLLRNDIREAGAGPSFVRVTARGVTSNRSGIGTELRLYRGGRQLRRYVRSGSSYLSQSELPVTFGLASDHRADSLVVLWPSGVRQTFTDVQAGRAYVVDEDADDLREEAI